MGFSKQTVHSGLALFLFFLSMTVLPSARAEGSMSTDVNLGVGITSYSGVNVTGGTGFESTVRQNLYLNKNIGLFAGISYSTRPMDLNVAKAIPSIGIPFGLVFQWGRGEMINQSSFGLCYTMPQKDFADTSETFKLKSGLGLLITSQLLFPVVEHFYLGPNVEIMFGLASPFEKTSLRSAKTLATVFGLTGSLQY